MILVFKQVSTLFYSSLFVVALILFFTGIMKYMALDQMENLGKKVISIWVLV